MSWMAGIEALAAVRVAWTAAGRRSSSCCFTPLVSRRALAAGATPTHLGSLLLLLKRHERSPSTWGGGRMRFFQAAWSPEDGLQGLSWLA